MSRRRKLAIAGLVVMLLLTIAGVGIWQIAQPPNIPEFYSDASVPDGAGPGTIIRTDPIDSRVEGVRFWRMVYVSTDLNDNQVAVSALIAAPDEDASAGGFPMVAVGHGTVGINRGCAPSVDPWARATDEQSTYEFKMGMFVDAGYAVVMSDYVGLGIDGPNSYLIGETEGRNILDSARAMLQFGEVPVQPEFIIAGQSQGGHAALFAAQIAPDYAPDLRVLGTVALAPAADLEAVFTGIIGSDSRGSMIALPMMAVDSFVQNYPDITLNDIVTDRGSRALRTVLRNVCVLPAILATQLARPSQIVQNGGIELMRTYIDANTPTGPFLVPVFIGQGDDDGVIPKASTDGIAQEFCDAGTNLTYQVYPGANHFTVVGDATADVLDWIEHVRAGGTPTTCA